MYKPHQTALSLCRDILQERLDRWHQLPGSEAPQRAARTRHLIERSNPVAELVRKVHLGADQREQDGHGLVAVVAGQHGCRMVARHHNQELQPE